MSKRTPGPWASNKCTTSVSVPLKAIDCERIGFSIVFVNGHREKEAAANARLIAAAPTQHAEMLRYLPVLERAEADSELWARLTDGLGIATLNGYRAAIKKAEEGEKT